MTEKQKIRLDIKNGYSTLADAELKSEIIGNTVLQSEQYANAENIFVYLSMKNEPSTDGIIADALSKQKNVYVPECISDTEMIAVKIYDTGSLISGMYGIREPAQTDETTGAGNIDLFIIPCMAASENRKRLGHGAGYYDRFIAGTDGVKMCLCFSDFLYGDLPADEHDITMDVIVTDKGAIR